MNTTIADGAPEPSGNPAPPAPLPAGRELLTLVRREFWEHRALWLCPLVVAGILVLTAVVVRAPRVDADDLAQLGPFASQQKVALFTIAQWALSMPLVVAASIMLCVYALDCLYAERKDRSILFWKSLPASDGLTVVSKALVAILIVPLGVYLLAAVTGLAFSALFSVRAALGYAPPVMSWDGLEWLKAEFAMLLLTILGVLWTAPITGYLILVSALSRRTPLVWATLPPLVGALLERIVFGTHYLWDFLIYRAFGIWHILGVEYSDIVTHHGLRPFGTLLDELNWRGAFGSIDLWLGVAATVAMLYFAVRLRRYHDES
jgi:ABC-2 type transport system permease protein